MRRRGWVPEMAEERVQSIAASVDAVGDSELGAVLQRIDALTDRNRIIHERECLQLNPAANVMNPRAEAAMSAGLGSRPSLGYPGDKYEMGLEAVEEIEVIGAALACRAFAADHAEVRVPSGAIANLYGFMACARPGDRIIAPPSSIAGHVTHHGAGAAGRYGLEIHDAPIDPERYTVDVDGVRELARSVRPAVITIGGSLNLRHHPVGALREIADEVGAVVLFDAAHLGGLIAGGMWPNPLDEGAHLMTMSTYKSLGGPPSGLLVTNDDGIAERVDAIAFPGLTANFDVGTTAALAISLVDTLRHGRAYAAEMVASARVLAAALAHCGVDVVGHPSATSSHAFALRSPHGDGHVSATRLRSANILTSAIGLPGDGDVATGVRVGTNEMVRWSMTAADMEHVARFVADGLHAAEPSRLADDVSAFRSRFDRLAFVQ